MIRKLQFTLDSLSNLDEILAQVTSDSHYELASSVVIKIFSRQLNNEKANVLVSKLRQAIPQGQIFGLHVWNDQEYFVDHRCVLHFIFFEKTTLLAIDEDCTEHNFDYHLKSITQKLKALPHLKAVEIVCSAQPQMLHEFIYKLSADRDDIVFFGVTDNFGCQVSIFGINDKRYVIGPSGCHNEGIVLLAYSGEELEVYADSYIGWKPIGKELTISKTEGNYCIEKIDDQSAAQIYPKYLNVNLDDNLIFNITEFPLITCRQGFEVARMPLSYDQSSGKLFFTSDITEGEKYRFSYTQGSTLINQARQRSLKLKEFAPEALVVYLCMNHQIFLGNKTAEETSPFLQLAPHSLYINGTSEIFRYHGQGGILNSALVVVGMHEEVKQRKASSIASQDQTPLSCSLVKVTPLAERLAAFLEHVTSELEEAVQEANIANAAKSNFLSNMSHEIRTPINAILGMNELILRESSEPQIREYASNIQKAGRSLLGIVNGILDFSKIEAGKMELLETAYDLRSLLSELPSLLSHHLGHKPIEFKMQVDQSLPSVLKGDDLRIKQIISNLLTNAFKYTQEGTVTLELHKVSQTEQSVSFLVKVSDTGIGIKEEDLPKLTKAFERIEEDRNRNIEGTGLGMSITVLLLKLMGSSLQVASTYGQGSTFSFVLKQEIVSREPIGECSTQEYTRKQSSSSYQPAFEAPDGKILVVDDNAMNLTVFKGLLKRTKLQIATAQSGLEALELCERNQYHLIFLDHLMPELDGIETLHRLKQIPRFEQAPVPVIALTANAITGARDMYLQAGFDDYLSKPIDPKTLEHLLLQKLPKGLTRKPSEDQEDHPCETVLPQWLAEVHEFNVPEGIANCGSAQDFLTALTIFARSLAPNLHELAAYLNQADYPNFTIKVHALKSSARIIGAKRLSELALQLELAGKQGQNDQIRASFPRLEALGKALGTELTPLTEAKEEHKEAQDLTQDELTEAFEQLKSAVSDYNFEDLQMILETLSEYQLPESYAGLLPKLQAAADKPDWDELLSLLNTTPSS
ncbi:MAG: response regulator [Succinivibrio sp.]|nr:response regulator [Succinivibrio sp.]